MAAHIFYADQYDRKVRVEAPRLHHGKNMNNLCQGIKHVTAMFESP